MSKGPLRSALAHLRRSAVRRMLRSGATRRGLPPDGLDRFDAYLDSCFGLAAPDYAHDAQRPRNYFPGLASRPFFEHDTFSWTGALEAAGPAITAEFEEVAQDEALQRHPQELAKAGTWDVFYFHVAGRSVDEHLARCPRTREALAGIPGVGEAGAAYFSIIRPGAHIPPHCGPTNTRLRCHLGLHTPTGCRIRVASEIRPWEAGRCLVFDDSFEHEVWNEGDSDRAVLIVDFWHPDLTEAERWAIVEMTRMSGGARRYRKNAEKIRRSRG